MEHIFCPKDLLVEMIVRREGNIPYRDRYNITQPVVNDILKRLISTHDFPLSNDWIKFFRRYGEMIKVTENNIMEISRLGILMFCKLPKTSKKFEKLFAESVDARYMVYRSYCEDYAYGYHLSDCTQHLPKWVTSGIDFSEMVLQSEFVLDERIASLTNTDTLVWSIINNSDHDFQRIVIEWCWNAGIPRYYPDIVGTEPETVKFYLDKMAATYQEVDNRIAPVLESFIKHNVEEIDVADLFSKLLVGNGNNLKLIYMVPSLSTNINGGANPMYLINSALHAVNPLRDFSIIANLYPDTLWDSTVKRIYKVCDLDKISKTRSNEAMSMDIMSIILKRKDAVEQLQKLIRVNPNVTTWIQQNINSFSFSQHEVIVRAYLESMKVSHLSIHTKHVLESTISTIIKCGSVGWIQQNPDILKYVYVPIITVNLAMKTYVGDLRQMYEAIPTTELTADRISKMIIGCDGHLKLNSKLPFEKLFPNLDQLYNIFFTNRRFEYIMDINSILVEQTFIDYLVYQYDGYYNNGVRRKVSVFTKLRIWLSQRFKYIL